MELWAALHAEKFAGPDFGGEDGLDDFVGAFGILWVVGDTVDKRAVCGVCGGVCQRGGTGVLRDRRAFESGLCGGEDRGPVGGELRMRGLLAERGQIRLRKVKTRMGFGRLSGER